MNNNSSQKILIASPFFYPELISTGKYNTFLVRKLVENEHEVTVICSYPFYPAWRPEFSLETISGADILRGGLNITYPKQTILRRLLLEAWYCRHFLKEAKKIPGKIDIFVAIVPPIIFNLFMNIYFKDAKKVAIIHDLLGVMATSSKSLVRRFVATAMKRVESFLLRRFDKVICLSESMKNVVIHQYGLKQEHCEVHYPFSTLEKGTDNTSELKKLFPANIMHLVYSGALGEKQKPKELYQFFANVCDNKTGIWCHIFSQGPIFDQLLKYNAHERIMFHDLVPESRLFELYAYSDIQIVPQAEGTGAGAFPSKLPNLIAAGVPVLAICDKGSELEKVILEANAGKIVSGWHEKPLMEALDSLIGDTNKETRPARKARAEKYVMDHFNIDKLVDSIVNP